MTSRVAYAPQDVQKIRKQAERDHESKKLVMLMDRVKKQIAERERRGPQGVRANVPTEPGGESVLRGPGPLRS
jgi:hypothetical protein